jgi:hypothetical protein
LDQVVFQCLVLLLHPGKIEITHIPQRQRVGQLLNDGQVVLAALSIADIDPTIRERHASDRPLRSDDRKRPVKSAVIPQIAGLLQVLLHSPGVGPQISLAPSLYLSVPAGVPWYLGGHRCDVFVQLDQPRIRPGNAVPARIHQCRVADDELPLFVGEANGAHRCVDAQIVHLLEHQHDHLEHVV